MSEEITTAVATATTPPAAKRGLRKTRVGTVISDKTDKTIIVRVVTRVPHAQLRKIVKQSTKFYAHDEKNEAHIGDRVSIAECRPISRTKRWRLVEVLAH